MITIRTKYRSECPGVPQLDNKKRLKERDIGCKAFKGGCLAVKWDDARKQYPEQWVVFEALLAHTEQNTRHVDDMAVIDCFSEGRDAMKRQHELHKGNPEREFYFFHTSRTVLDIIERPWAGIRGVQ